MKKGKWSLLLGVVFMYACLPTQKTPTVQYKSYSVKPKIAYKHLEGQWEWCSGYDQGLFSDTLLFWKGDCQKKCPTTWLDTPFVRNNTLRYTFLPEGELHFESSNGAMLWEGYVPETTITTEVEKDTVINEQGEEVIEETVVDVHMVLSYESPGSSAVAGIGAYQLNKDKCELSIVGDSIPYKILHLSKKEMLLLKQK